MPTPCQPTDYFHTHFITYLRSHDSDQCRAAMDWCQRLCTLPFDAAATSPSSSAGGGSDGGGGAGSRGAAAAASTVVACWPGSTLALGQLRAWLDRGAGAQLVQSLLLAAAGSMPSNLVLPISAALHRIWRAVGNERWVLVEKRVPVC